MSCRLLLAKYLFSWDCVRLYLVAWQIGFGKIAGVTWGGIYFTAVLHCGAAGGARRGSKGRGCLRRPVLTGFAAITFGRIQWGVMVLWWREDDGASPGASARCRASILLDV